MSRPQLSHTRKPFKVYSGRERGKMRSAHAYYQVDFSSIQVTHTCAGLLYAHCHKNSAACGWGVQTSTDPPYGVKLLRKNTDGWSILWAWVWLPQTVCVLSEIQLNCSWFFSCPPNSRVKCHPCMYVCMYVWYTHYTYIKCMHSIYIKLKCIHRKCVDLNDGRPELRLWALVFYS